MTGVGAKRNAHRAAVGGLVRARETLVVLHVAAAVLKVRIPRFFKLSKDHLCRLASNVVQNIDATAVRHSQHALFCACFRSTREHRIKHNKQRLTTFKTEALLANESGC